MSNEDEEAVEIGFEYEDCRPEWIKEKVEEFTFDTRVDVVHKVAIDFRIEKESDERFNQEKMSMS